MENRSIDSSFSPFNSNQGHTHVCHQLREEQPTSPGQPQQVQAHPQPNPDPTKCSGSLQERCQVHCQPIYLILLTYLAAPPAPTPPRCSVAATPNSRPGCADSPGDLAPHRADPAGLRNGQRERRAQPGKAASLATGLRAAPGRTENLSLDTAASAGCRKEQKGASNVPRRRRRGRTSKHGAVPESAGRDVWAGRDTGTVSTPLLPRREAEAAAAAALPANVARGSWVNS